MKRFFVSIFNKILSFFFEIGKNPCKCDLGCDVKKMKKFLEVLRPFCDFENFNRWAVFTHAFHETGGFEKAIGNNYFGIKKPKMWTGKVAYITTHEYISGVKRKVNLYFADWETLAEALIWYGSLIKRLYPLSFKNRENPESYFIGLVAGKYLYATDPNYVTKLKNMYGKLRASEYIKNLVEK